MNVARQSRRLTNDVNVAKLLLLATMTPAVIAGIAQRAAELPGRLDVAAVVANTAAIGAVGEALGALGIAWLSDAGVRRWGHP